VCETTSRTCAQRFEYRETPVGAEARPNGRTLAEGTAAHVRALQENEASGHDWWHTDRVRRTALRLAAEEGADPLVVELAALLHDVGDWKLAGGDIHAAPRLARDWLESQGADAAVVDHVAEIVATLSFKGAGVPTPMRTVEGAVVQDADRLDAIGAIGVARAFAYGGSRGRPLHDPDAAPRLHASFEEYRRSAGGTLNHFHEKLLLLRDRMNTPTARAIAEERHRFMEEFVARFVAEWGGEG
jgi:uncharacterized protein